VPDEYYDSERSTWPPSKFSEKAKLDFPLIEPDEKYTVFVLGAGASKDAGFPICTDFFNDDYLNQIGLEVKWDRSYEKSAIGIEQHLMEAFASDENRFLRLRQYYERVLFKAESRFLNVSGEVSTKQWVKDSRYYFLLLALFFEGVSSGRRVIVISFNHDLCIEELLRMSGFNYGTLTKRMYGVGEYPGLPDFGNDIVLLKLHGSFNFAHCPQCNGIWCDSQWLWDKGERWPCAQCGAPGYNFYVPPTVIKNVSALLESWEDARHFLQNAEDVFVIGYSLPEYDAHAVDLFREISSTANLAIINPQAGDIAEKFTFVSPSRISCCPLGLKNFTTSLLCERWDFIEFKDRAFCAEMAAHLAPYFQELASGQP
jgi:hypothetical protein